MKTEWKSPKLEVLDVNMTMASPKVGESLDSTFNAGTKFKDLRWS